MLKKIPKNLKWAIQVTLEVEIIDKKYNCMIKMTKESISIFIPIQHQSLEYYQHLALSYSWCFIFLLQISNLMHLIIQASYDQALIRIFNDIRLEKFK